MTSPKLKGVVNSQCCKFITSTQRLFWEAAISFNSHKYCERKLDCFFFIYSLGSILSKLIVINSFEGIFMKVLNTKKFDKIVKKMHIQLKLEIRLQIKRILREAKALRKLKHPFTR